MKKKHAAAIKADIFDAVIVDPIADMIKRTANLGFTIWEIQDGLQTALMHAQAELAREENFHAQ